MQKSQDLQRYLLAASIGSSRRRTLGRISFETDCRRDGTPPPGSRQKADVRRAESSGGPRPTCTRTWPMSLK